MRRLLIASLLLIACLALACLAPASAQFAEAVGTTTTKPVAGGPVSIGQTMAQVDPDSHKVAIIQAPPLAGAPADTTSFSLGTWIANLLGGLVAIFGSVIATFITKWVMAIAKKAGVQATQAVSDRLDEIVKNGLHAGALEAQKSLTGKMNVTTKNEVVARAVQYAQAHGADTIKQLSGLDVGDPKTVTALQARAAKALEQVGPEAILTTTTIPVAANNVANAAPSQETTVTTTTKQTPATNGTPPT